MPLWDSVQRSLEKASQEAARIAKTQRLRSTIDGLSRQVTTQQTMIFNRTMDLFLAGQLTQSELASLCQELVQSQQQLNQAQFELKHLQSSQAQPDTSNQYPPATEASTSLAPTVYTPRAYQAYLDSTQGATVAPPPPGVEALTPGGGGGDSMAPAAPPTARQLCQVCQVELSPSVAFCHSCGAPVQDIHASHSPTVRAGKLEASAMGDQASAPGSAPGHEARGNEGV